MVVQFVPVQDQLIGVILWDSGKSIEVLSGIFGSGKTSILTANLHRLSADLLWSRMRSSPAVPGPMSLARAIRSSTKSSGAIAPH